MQLPSRSVTALLCLIAVYALGGWGLAVSFGVGDRFTLLLYSEVVVQVTVMLFLIFVGWRMWTIILFERPARLGLRLIQDIRARLFTRAQIRQAVPIFIGFMVFMSAFTSMKGLIPLVQPYHWDESFAAWDRALHFGVDPWKLLQPVFGYPWITSALNIIYNLWFVVMFSVLYWQLFDLRCLALRMRFFWTFFLTWMLNGSILAMVFSSAGPCFYDHVVQGPNPFAAQMEYLRGLTSHYPVWAVDTQQGLWNTYKQNRTGLGSGISAMPSVHVAIATLFVLLGWHYGRAARIFFCIFAACIMIGSVHLAWHYAIDGYAGALVTLLIWTISGWIFRNASEDAATVHYPAGPHGSTG